MGFKIEFGGDRGSAEEKRYEREEVAIQKSIGGAVYCIFYALIGGTPYQVGSIKRIPAGVKEFRQGKKKYIVQPEKIRMRRIKRWFVRWMYVAVLEYRIGYSLPLAMYESAIEQDADALDRVTNEENIPKLLPNPNRRLEMITLVALILCLVFGGGFMYLILNPDASDQIQEVIRGKPSKPSGPVVITPTPAPGGG